MTGTGQGILGHEGSDGRQRSASLMCMPSNLSASSDACNGCNALLSLILKGHLLVRVKFSTCVGLLSMLYIQIVCINSASPRRLQQSSNAWMVLKGSCSESQLESVAIREIVFPSATWRRSAACGIPWRAGHMQTREHEITENAQILEL